MLNPLRRSAVVLSLLAGLAGADIARAQVYSQFKDALPMIQRSVLNDPQDQTGVPEGRMGGIAYDPTSQCMYFAALRSGALIVLDPSGMTRLQVIRELNEPSNIAIFPEARKLVLTGGDGTAKIFTIAGDGKLTQDKSISLAGEADQVRADVKAKRAFIGHGKFISWVNPTDGTKCDKPVELPGPTKGIVLDPGSARLFATIPSKNQIVVIDRGEWKIVATWDLKGVQQPGPVAMDEQNSRLFVAGRSGNKLLVLNSSDGKEAEQVDIGADAGDCCWDPMGKRVYISCGQPGGQVSMLRDVNGKIVVEHQVDTAPGARTSVFIPERRRYIVCAPKQGDASGGMPTFVYIYVLPNLNDHNEPQPKSH